MGIMGPNLPARFNAAVYFVERHLAEGRGDAPAIRFGEERITYASLACRVNQTANLLRALGVGSGDRVFILLPDSPSFAAAFWGAIKMGAVALPNNTFLSPETYEALLRDSSPRCIVVDRSLLPAIEPGLSRLRTDSSKDAILLAAGPYADSDRKGRCHCASPAATLGYQILDFEEELAKAHSLSEAAPTRPSDPALWLYTSGSTGQPKAAIHCHRDMVCCFEGFARGVLDISSKDVCYSVSKLFFAYGLGNSLYFPSGVGAESVLVPERLTPDRAFDILREHRPSLFFAVPTFYAAMLRVSHARREDFQSIRCAVSAGEALPAVIAEEFERRFGVQLLDGIGSTEMLQTFISNRPGRIRYGSSGIPVPGYEARIVDEAGCDVPTGEIGNLWIRGASAASGYWNRIAQTQETFRGDWTVTGDKYRCDAEGFYWHCGRSDDMLKINGLWVSPLEIEAALLSHSSVAECAVVGFKNGNGFVRPRAFVSMKNSVAQDGEDSLSSELTSFLRERISAHKVPTSFVFVNELPKTATGKIQRFKLRQT